MYHQFDRSPFDYGLTNGWKAGGGVGRQEFAGLRSASRWSYQGCSQRQHRGLGHVNERVQVRLSYITLCLKNVRAEYLAVRLYVCAFVAIVVGCLQLKIAPKELAR